MKLLFAIKERQLTSDIELNNNNKQTCTYNNILLMLTEKGPGMVV
jgi:hypothetical protein